MPNARLILNGWLKMSFVVMHPDIIASSLLPLLIRCISNASGVK